MCIVEQAFFISRMTCVKIVEIAGYQQGNGITEEKLCITRKNTVDKVDKITRNTDN